MIIIADNQSLTSDALTSYLAGQPLLFVHKKEDLARQLETYPDAIVVLDFALFDFTSPENFLFIFAALFPFVGFCYRLNIPKTFFDCSELSLM